MKKFGFGSKKSDPSAEEDSNRSALFSSRKSKPDSKANPYAQQDVKDPYAAPPAYSNGSLPDDPRMEKSPVPAGGYGGAPAQSRYGAPAGGSYGQSNGGGYSGSNPYGQDQQQPAASRYGQRSGGYGGMGAPRDPAEDDGARAALFGDAPKRTDQAKPAPGGYGAAPGGYGASNGGYGAPGAESRTESGAGGYGAAAGADAGGYGAYQDRELTQEEQEEEDVTASKQQIRYIKQQDVSSTRNALRIAQMAEETGRQTLERLGAQGERIHNTEKNLDLASTQNRLAEEKARELKTLNRSMFAVHVGNPFTKEKKMRDRDNQILENNRRDREQRDATRNAAWSSQARADETSRELRGGPPSAQQSQKNLAARSKYQFEADSEDEAMEDEIDGNLDALHGAAKGLKGLSLAMGREVDSQNKHIDRIIKKTDKVDDEIAVNRGRLDRIR